MDAEIELFLDSFIARMDSEFSPDGQISLKEWVEFAAHHSDIRSFLAEFEFNASTF